MKGNRGTRRGATLVACTIAMLGASGCIPTKDVNSIPSTARAATALAAGAPAPLWSSQLKDREVDIIRFLSKDRVLVGTVGMESVGFSIFVTYRDVPAELAAYDLGSGRVLWRHARTAVGSERQTVLGTDPVVLLRGESGSDSSYEALDPATGNVVWKRTVNGAHRYESAVRAGLGIFESISASALTLAAVRLKDGTPAWSARLDGFGKTEIGKISTWIDDTGLTVSGPVVARYGLADGKEQWKAPFPGSWGEGSVALIDKEFALLSDGSNLVSLDPATGSTTFSQPVGGGKVRLASHAQHCEVAAVSTGQASSEVRCFDKKSGQQLWAAPAPGELTSPLLVLPDSIAFATLTTLFVVDATSGKLRGSGAFPAPLSVDGLPDLIQLVGDRIVVARESGVAAFSSSDGSLLFAEPVTGGRQFTFGFQKVRLALARQALAGSGEAKAPPSSAMGRLGGTDAFYRQALQHQRYVYATTSSTLRQGSGSTSADRTSALNAREAAAGNTAAMGEMQAYLDLASAGVQFGVAAGLAIVGVASAVISEYGPATLARMQAQLSHSVATHLQSLAGPLYVRPFYDRGWKLAVVNVTKGKRADLVLSPPNTPLRYAEASNFQTVGIDPSASRLVAKGLGLDAARYQGYEFIHRIHIDGKRRRWTIPLASLLCFDGDGLPFGQEARKGPSRAQGDERESPALAGLMAAARGCDDAAVQQGLSAGADVNGADAHGRTALMHAVQNACLDTVKLLLSKGARLEIEDLEGLRAYDYLFLPPMFGTAKESRSEFLRQALMEAYGGGGAYDQNE